MVNSVGGGSRTAVKVDRVAEGERRYSMVSRLPLAFAGKCLMARAANTAAVTYGVTCGGWGGGEAQGARRAAVRAVRRGGRFVVPEVLFSVLAPSWRLDPFAIATLTLILQALRMLGTQALEVPSWQDAAGAYQAGQVRLGRKRRG